MTTVLPHADRVPELDVLHPGHFAYRHIGPRREDVAEMLAAARLRDRSTSFIDAVVPEEIRLRRPLALPPGRSEREVLAGAPRAGRHEPGLPLVHRHGLRRHASRRR